MSIYPENDKKFAAVKALNLPIGEYAITSSGPLGIREVREIGDVDLIVSDRLWQEFLLKHELVTTGGFQKIIILPMIDVLCERSFPHRTAASPTVEQQIRDADIIDGLPFVSLPHVLYFKETMGREKDKLDVEAIHNLLY